MRTEPWLELYSLLIVHYAVRATMLDAADQAGRGPDRLSFRRALCCIGEAISDFQVVPPAQHPRRYDRLLGDLVRDLLPCRPNRSNPRVVKRKMSKFPLKREAHRQPPTLTRDFCDIVQILAPPQAPPRTTCLP